MFIVKRKTGNAEASQIQANASKGATMLEILVSILVLSLGLLGVAGLQTTGLKSNHSAYLRSQATHIANDIIDRMRTNREGVGLGLYSSVNSSTLPANPNCISTAAGCNATQLAQHDIREWALSGQALLPSFVGSISVDGLGTATTRDDVFVIRVQWNDKSDTNRPNKTLRINVRI